MESLNIARHGPLKWFRLYHEALHDPKVQTLPLEQFKAWFNLLCMASANPRRGVIPPVKDVAFTLRMSEVRARSIVDALVTCGLINRDGQGELRPHNWEVRQPPTDDINGRVASWRARKAKEGKGVKAKKPPEPSSQEPQNVTLHPTLPVTGDVTVSNGRVRRDSDTEREREEEESLSNDNDSARGVDDVVVDGGTFQVVSPEHLKTIDHARVVIGEKFAAVVADRGSSLDSSLQGRWDCYRAAIDELKRIKATGKTIDKPAVYCRSTALSYVLHGIPRAVDEPLVADVPSPRVYPGDPPPQRQQPQSRQARSIAVLAAMEAKRMKETS